MYLDISGMIMFQKHLRKEFSRALSKATLIVMLPLTLAALPAAAAQEQAPAAPATATEQVQTPASAPAADTTATTAPEEASSDDVIIKEGDTIVVLPQRETDIDSLEKRYPFLKEVLADVRLYNEEFKDTPTKVMTSTVRDTAQNVELVFVSVQGPMTCGANQCQMNIFVNAGEGYKQATAGPAPLPVHVLKDKGEVSLYFCSVDNGRAQWVLKNGTLDFVGNVTAPQSGPACPAPSAAANGPQQ